MLREKRVQYQTIINELTQYLTRPRMDDQGVWLSARPTPTGCAYYWMGHPQSKPNMIAYAGFQCGHCQQGVYRTKRAMSLGQGRKMIIHSCWCITAFMPPCPPGKRIALLTLEIWTQKVEQARELESRSLMDTERNTQ